MVEEKRAELFRGAAAAGRRGMKEERIQSCYGNIYCEYKSFLRVVEEYHHWLLEARD